MTKEEIIAAYIKKHGKNQASNVLNWIAKTEPFIEAISTELGQQIMSVHIDRADRCFYDYHNLLDAETDISKLSIKTILARAEYNVSIKIIHDVQTIINKYHKDRI